MTFEDFLNEYERIRQLLLDRERWETWETGITPDPALQNRKGGFFLSLVYPPEFTKKAHEFSKAVYDITASVLYGPEHVHTTAGSIDGTHVNQFYFEPENAIQADRLEKLCRVAKMVAAQTKANSLEIDFYMSPIVPPHAVIIPGDPNEIIAEIANAVVECGNEVGLQMNPGWGAHLTLARFTEARAPDRAKEIISLIKLLPRLGTSRPIGIAAGYSERHPQERRLSTNLADTPGHPKVVKFYPFS